MNVALAALTGLLLTSSIAAHAEESEPGLLMARRGDLLLRDDLRQPLGKEWVGKPGKWETVEGVLQGAELKADNHPAVRRHPLRFQNAVIQYEFRLQGARQTTLSLNDAGGHVARVLLRTDGFTVQKDDHDHEGPDRAVVFERRAMTLESGRWYTLVVEILGEEIVAHIDDHVGFGADPLVGSPKRDFGLTVSGESAQFRNLRVWEALPNPDWAETRRRLLAGRK